jgi:hypothetical protein
MVSPYTLLTRKENSRMVSEQFYPFGETKSRDFEYVKSSTARDTLSITDPITHKISTSSSSYNVGQYGRETTTSRKGSNWMSFQELKRKGFGPGDYLYDFLSKSDLGTGGFMSVKKYQEFSHPRDLDLNLDITEGIYRYQYRGPWVAVDSNVGPTSTRYPAVPGDLLQRSLNKGATAIARTIPTNPVAGAAQFLGELREGLPRLPGRAIARKGPIGVADEYLNVEFGFKPFISDLRKFGEAARSASKQIEQLKRDSGRLIRRRYTFPVERTTTTTVVSTNAYGAPGFRLIAPKCYDGGPGKLTKTRDESYEFWFSGAYTYAYPDGDTAVGRMRQAESRMNRLFGTRVSPELFWELTPWSWAFDWISNTGDVIHNLTALSNDSLVLRWGYIMCHYTCRDTYLLDGVAVKGSTGGPRSQTFVTDVKTRYRATPYGFGLDIASFSPRQWAILGALGISRAQGML